MVAAAQYGSRLELLREAEAIAHIKSAPFRDFRVCRTLIAAEKVCSAVSLYLLEPIYRLSYTLSGSYSGN